MDIAANLQQQVTRMRRQVDYHLAQARAAASGADPSARCQVLTSVDGLVRTMHRLHAERGLRIDVELPGEHSVRATRADLDEMLGNLLDNACKWAASRVLVTSRADEGRIIIDVDDDGRGLEPSMREAVLQRGCTRRRSGARFRPRSWHRPRTRRVARRLDRARRIAARRRSGDAVDQQSARTFPQNATSGHADAQQPA